MEENRKTLIISGISLALLMCLIALLILVANPWEELQSLITGSMLGIIFGALLCCYILYVWNPVTMQRRGNKANNFYLGCWSPVIVIGGIIGMRLLSSHLGIEFVDMLVGTFLSAITLILFVPACMAWWYRPK